MAKGRKLTKLKSVLKKWNSFSKLGCPPNGDSSLAAAARHSSSNGDENEDIMSTTDLHPVYVGKSRRRYLVTSNVIDNPVFRELIDRSGDNDDNDNSVTIGCEVVLFEHLLWMLERADPHPESLEDLVDYYAC
ncbi:hypothetical protein NMG60_11013707 [Bertholletia excelsa]